MVRHTGRLGTSRGMVLFSIAMVLAVALSACSSSGGNKASSSSGGEPILIGAAMTEGSVSTNFESTEAAMRAAIRKINAAGGVKGRSLKLDYCNPGLDPNRYAACGRQFVKDKVVATVLDAFDPGSTEEPDILKAAGIPRVFPVTSGQADLTYPNSYPQGYVVVASVITPKFLAAMGEKKLFTVITDTPTLQPLVGVVTQVAKQAGMQVVANGKVPLSGIGDPAPLAEQIKSSGADSWWSLISDQNWALLAPALSSAGADVVGASSVTPASKVIVQATGGKAKAVQFWPYPPLSSADKIPAMASYKAALQSEMASGDKNTDVSDPWPIAAMGYFGVVALARLLGQLPEINAKAVTEGLNKGMPLDDGINPPVKFNKAGPISFFPRAATSYGYPVEFNGGKFGLIQGTKPVDAAPIMTAAGMK